MRTGAAAAPTSPGRNPETASTPATVDDSSGVPLAPGSSGWAPTRRAVIAPAE